MKKLVLIISIYLVLFTGCASISYLPPEVENLSYPELNIKTTKNIGDTLVSQSTRFISDGIEFLTDANKGKVSKGIYKVCGTQQGYIVYEPVVITGAKIKPILTTPCFLALKENKLYYCAYGGYGNIFAFDEIPASSYINTKAEIESSNTFQQTLIYTGKENDIIKISYREFSGSLARPAFTVDATYNLSESDEIAFKEAKLKILSANNTSIVYVVIKNFN